MGPTKAQVQEQLHVLHSEVFEWYKRKDKYLRKALKLIVRVPWMTFEEAMKAVGPYDF